MLSLTKRLEPAGYGRIGFAFNVVFWLVLLVRDGVEVIAARELARHPRLIRPLVNHVLAVKGVLAIVLFAGLVAVGSLTLSDSIDRTILSLYGLMLLTTALGLDFVYRGTERMGLVAVSLSIRTLIYAIGVWYWVTDASRIVWVPALLALGEVCGIALVWACYIRKYGVPRPVLGGRFLRVFLRRGRSVCLIQVSQTVIGSADFMVVGLMSQWADVGRYGAPHQMITAVLTFGLIFQQVVFPTLARSWRKTAASGRQALNGLVQVLVAGLIPVAVGGTILAGPLVRFLPEKYAGASLLLALGIWKAPLLNLAYLYQTTLIAVNREAAGVRLLAGRGDRVGPDGRALLLVFRPGGGHGGGPAHRARPGGRRIWVSRPRGEATGLASSPGAPGDRLAGHDSRLPRLATRPRAGRHRGGDPHLHPRPGRAGRLPPRVPVCDLPSRPGRAVEPAGPPGSIHRRASKLLQVELALPGQNW